MTRFSLTACAGLLAVAMAAPSYAADLPRPAYKAPYPAYVAPFSWTGFYIGINGGYAYGKSDWSSTVTSASTSPKGWLVGGTLGYNLQTGLWVWGLEADIDYSTIDGTGTGTGLCAGVGCETKLRWFGTARGRIGYAYDRWLPFITGGAAFGNIKMTPTGGTSDNKTQVGWTVGAGVEYAFVGGWSTKLEYLYADLGNATCGAATCGIDTEVSYKTNMVRLGVNFRF